MHPIQNSLEHANNTDIASATIAFAFTYIIAAADAFVVESSPVQLTESRPTFHHHWQPELDTIPDLQAPFGSLANANDGNHTLAPTIAVATGGDITAGGTCVTCHAPVATYAPSASFSSRHSTFSTICRTLAPTADADGPSIPGGHRPYHSMSVKKLS